MSVESDLLDGMRAGKAFDIDRSLLIASGLTSESDIQSYKRKLDEIHQRFQAKINDKAGLNRVLDDAQRERKDYRFLIDDPHILAGFLLHRFLYEDKPERYNSEFLFHRVIDNQLSEETQLVGNCLGLSCLYHALGNRMGLTTNPIIVTREGYNHVLLHQTTSQGNSAPVESTMGDGFNYCEERGREGDSVDLVNELYVSRWKRAEEPDEQLRLADISLRLRPDDVNILVWRTGKRIERGNMQGAYEDASRAIMVDPCDIALLRYAQYLERTGNIDEATRYARIAQSVAPDFKPATDFLSRLEQKR